MKLPARNPQILETGQYIPLPPLPPPNVKFPGKFSWARLPQDDKLILWCVFAGFVGGLLGFVFVLVVTR